MKNVINLSKIILLCYCVFSANANDYCVNKIMVVNCFDRSNALSYLPFFCKNFQLDNNIYKNTLEKNIKYFFNYYRKYNESDSAVITCSLRPALIPKKQCFFTLTLSSAGQEIENKYIANAVLYARALQYLNYGIAHDVYLRLPGQPDSTVASAAYYARQYGMTGRSTVLLTFPLSEHKLRSGCQLIFYGKKLNLAIQRFIFSPQAIKLARRNTLSGY